MNLKKHQLMIYVLTASIRLSKGVTNGYIPRTAQCHNSKSIANIFDNF